MKLVPRHTIEQSVGGNMICPRRIVLNSTIETFTNSERFNLQLFTVNIRLFVNIFKTISSDHERYQIHVPAVSMTIYTITIKIIKYYVQ